MFYKYLRKIYKKVIIIWNRLYRQYKNVVIWNKRKKKKRKENKYDIMEEGRNSKFVYAHNKVDQSYSTRNGLNIQKKKKKTQNTWF